MTQRSKESPPAPDIATGSPDRFGYSWDKFTELSPVQEEQFNRWSSALPVEQWQDALFLDVGCGMGRNSVWACKKGGKGGDAIDVDERSLAAAKQNLQDFAVDTHYMSAYEIEFKEKYDVAFSIGVIHHLEHPQKAIQQMVQAVKPGGKVLVWLYGRENNGWIVNIFNPVRKLVFSRLPLSVVNVFAWILTYTLSALLHLGWGKLPYHDILRKTDMTHLKHIVLDHMIPQIALYYTKEEAEDLLKQAGLGDVSSVWVNKMSWSVVGTKK
ncbi:MAG: class I SAM-dependent methyltransferase [Magnetococcales bacterium]|nr:class I SAM-dependent methyltransferase [Magnetococcales bacterium]